MICKKMKEINKFLEEATKINDLINETRSDNMKDFPSVKELGNGVFEGALWGHCFLYEGKKYYVENVLLNIYPCNVRITINGEHILVEAIDHYQKPELVNQFKDIN